jgi:vancomycin resistance protein YoaR
MGFLGRAIILVGIGSAVAGGGYAAKKHFAPEGQPLSGIKVHGATLAPGEDLAALVHAQAGLVTARHVSVSTDAEPGAVLLETTLADLGVSVDEEATLSRVRSVGRDDDLLARIDHVQKARHGQIDVPLVLKTDDARALSILEGLRDRIDRGAVSARMDLDKRGVVPETAGRSLATQDGVSEVARLAESTDDKLVVHVVQVKPRVSASFLMDLDVSTVVSEYETFFSRGGDQARRGKNIDNAAGKLDGTVLFPGELVSFNQIVGERSEENGFQKSWEIFKGEMVEGVGGGTCQVASTFHAAAFFGGLDVLERLPHSRPSAYIPMGLDSTVVYPSVDLKIKNPHPFAIVVHTKTADNKLVVQFLGRERPVSVGFGRELVETIPYPRKVIEEPDLTGKKVRVKQHGIRGYKIKRSRVLTYKTGEQRTERTLDTYPPTTEIYAVPPGFDESLLPALPAEKTDESAPAAAIPGAAPAAGAVASSTTKAPEGAASDGSGQTAQAEVTFVDGPGAHAPTSAQANPAKSMWLRR